MMKKLLFFFIVTIVSVSYINAQSISLSWEGAALGDTTSIWVDPSSVEPFNVHVAATNNTGEIMNVKILRTNIELIEGTTNSYCWADQCYSPFVDESPDYVTVVAGGTTDEIQSLKTDFYANNAIGTTIVKYRFFNVANEEEFAEIVVKYWSSPEGLEEEYAKNIKFSNAYPNPASSQFSLDYSFDMNVDAASLKIVNLLGSVVKEVELDQTSNNINVDVNDLTSGIYFYSVVVDNEVIQTKKLVIR